jgi:very-short-patch-repair endonuclease
MSFTHNIEELSLLFNTRKDPVVYFLKRHFKEGIHYIIVYPNKGKKTNGYSGQNKQTYLLTEETYELVKSSYNLKHRYLSKVMDVKMVNPLLMTIENSTIGFICDMLNNVIECKRQHRVGNYYIDLYLPSARVAIECDEFGHNKSNPVDEKAREDYIQRELNCQFIRFNPCSEDFQFAQLLNRILTACL